MPAMPPPPPPVPPYPSMKLFVKTMHGTNFYITLQPTDTVVAVKKQIEDMRGKDYFPCAHLNLFRNNTSLMEDDTTLAANNVSKDDFLGLSVRMVPCPRKGCPCKLEEEEEEEERNIFGRMMDQIEREKEVEGRDFSLKPHVWTKKKHLADDLVVTQILSRLPAKTLMRFKSIRKGWQSIIEQDSHFINLHRTHSQARLPRLLIIVPNRKTNEESRACFNLLSADLDCNGSGRVRGASIRSAMSVRVPSPTAEVFGPVRGLLCFVDVANFDVLIYNVSTGQAVTPWIRSSVSLKKLPFKYPVCEFGFDPNTGEHKVIFVWHDSPKFPGTPIASACEVLTVGVDTSWRIIHAIPTCRVFRCKSIYAKSIYANGSIYWLFNKRETWGYSESLVVFDIGPEKFRTITIPIFTRSMRQEFPKPKLIELDGCPTIVRLDTPGAEMQTLWKFDDRNKNETSDTTTLSRSESEDWTAVSIKLPLYIPPEDVTFHPIPGKDQIIFVESYNKWLPGHFERACFYSYNRVNKTFSKFEIRGIPSLPEHSGSRCKFFIEDLFHAAEDKNTLKNPS